MTDKDGSNRQGDLPTEQSADASGIWRETADASGVWRPIETAPKTEFEQVLLYDLDIGVCTGYWSDPYGWQVSDGASSMEGDCTHWMPYPDPPKDAAP